MQKHQTTTIVYIARKFIVNDRLSKHYYEEEVFDSIDAASNFISSISYEDNTRFFSEIVTCYLNNEDIDKDKYTNIYDCNGNLIWSSVCHYDQCEHDQDYNIGEIVTIMPFPWNPFSPTYIKTIGVVSCLPKSFDDKNNYTHNEEYIIECIRSGFLYHWHVKKYALQKYTDDIPENMSFLKILSDHYKKIKVIPEDILNAVYNGELFVEKVHHYNF